MRREKPSEDTFCHVYNRGVDKRIIFAQKRDYERFLLALFLFNDVDIYDYDLKEFNLHELPALPKQRTPLVEIIHWCLMPNHFHLLLRPLVSNGVSIFMQKVGTGYTMYFNTKYERSGRLFQGTFKLKLVEKDEYFSHLCAYIPLNAADLFCKEWKEKGISRSELDNVKRRMLYYPWSSYREYLGEPIIFLCSKESFFEIFGGSLAKYKQLVDAYLATGLPKEYEDQLRTSNYEAKPRSFLLRGLAS